MNVVHDLSLRRAVSDPRLRIYWKRIAAVASNNSLYLLYVLHACQFIYCPSH